MLPKFRDAADRNYISEGGGVTVGDVDGDGRPDVYLTRPFGGGRLFRNLGDFKFEDVTEQSGLKNEQTWCAGASFVDIDNDHDLDLFVCAYHSSNRLYINDGQGRFSEQSKRFGLDFKGASVMIAFADYDLDGDLDGYLVVNRYEFDDDGNPLPMKGQVAVKRNPAGGFSVDDSQKEQWGILARPDTGAPVLVKAGQYNCLYRNDGDKGFVNVAQEAGVASNGLSLSASWWDYNLDGLPDLYVANDFFGPDHLFENQGDGTFLDVAPDKLPHTPWFSMGTDIGDINNDGLLDFIGTDMAGTDHYKANVGMGDIDRTAWFLEMGRPRQCMRNAMFINAGTKNPFLEIAHLANLDATDWTWSPKFGDLDCDGRLDLFVTNGMTGDFFNADLLMSSNNRFPRKPDRNFAFRNLGDLAFEDVSQQWGLDELNISFGAALADLDGDGDLDLTINRYDASASVYRNQSASGNCLKVSLHGTRSNAYGVGAMVEVETDAGLQVRYHSLARGFMSTNEPVLHFGLGEAEIINKLVVRWPGGDVQAFENLPVNQHFEITEPKTSPESGDDLARPKTKPLYRAADGLGWRHLEQPFDDFSVQPLLPNKLSQLGPGIAVSDVDDDGDEDLYLCGASGQPGSVAINHDGAFRPSRASFETLREDAACEDMGALFFDADGDRDPDLYVVSGGVENGADSPLLEDRLYLNQGDGNFQRAPTGSLPAVRDSGSCVAAADYDQDGDLDLFVGSRVVPGEYPISPTSRLLRNESTAEQIRFVDATESDASELARAGMVTGALWSDVDTDGDPDLLVTLEWGPVKLYQNFDGHFSDATEAAGLADRQGWWNGIAGCDVDHDGDIDYAVTNFGLNTKYQVDNDNPALIYYGDFEGWGKSRIIEAVQSEGRVWPVRSLSDMLIAFPTLEEKFRTVDAYAKAQVSSIFPQQQLDSALKLTVNELRSGVLLNDGKGRFAFQPLPVLAQVAPSSGVAFCYADSDEHVDLFVVQNFFGPQRLTGRLDGGLGALMLGDGTGQFKSLRPDQSGLVLPGDAEGLAKTDLNGDGAEDFIATINNQRIRTFHAQNSSPSQWRLKLHGLDGNPTGIGAKLTVTTSHESGAVRHSSEVYAGDSYLSQSSPLLTFPRGNKPIAEVIVSWPDGIVQKQEVAVRSDGPVEIYRDSSFRKSLSPRLQAR